MATVEQIRERRDEDGTWERCSKLARKLWHSSTVKGAALSDSIIEADRQLRASEPEPSNENEAGDFKSSTVSHLNSVRWVFDNIRNGQAKRASCPSPGAWGLLKWAKDNQDEFYKAVWSKTLPSRQQIEASEKGSDDGRAVLAALDRAEQAIFDGSLGEGVQSPSRDDGGGPAASAGLCEGSEPVLSACARGPLAEH